MGGKNQQKAQQTKQNLGSGGGSLNGTAGCQKPQTGAIRVTVTTDAGAIVANADVTASGTEPTDGAGVASFDSLAPNTYTVDVSTPLPDAVKDDFYLQTPSSKQVKVKAGQTAQVAYRLKPKPAPTISVDAPKIVLVKHAYQGKKKPPVKAHRIAVKLGMNGQYDGVGELSCDHTDHIRVFEKENDTTEKTLPWKIPAKNLRGGKTVWLEGKAASDAVPGEELKLALKDGTIPVKPDATENITCVLLQLNVFAVRPEDGSDPTQIADDKKIDPGRSVLVQGATDQRLWAQRAKLAVMQAQPTAYTGKVVLKSIGDKVQAFDASEETPAAGQTAKDTATLKWDNASIDGTDGQILWVQGGTRSAAMGDTGWTVEIEDLPGKEGDRVTMTVLKAELALYQSRTDAPAKTPKPNPFSDDDKFDKGRYIHQQNAQFQHGRAMILVKKVLPDGFAGTLVLSAWNAVQTPTYSATKAGSPTCAVFEAEVAAGGQTAKTLPLEIDHPATYPSGGKTFWVEGTTISTALRDCELRLGVKDIDSAGDRVEFTVVKFANFKVDAPSTPANIARNRKDGGPSNTPTPRHDFVAGANDDAKHYSDDFTVNEPLPLVEGSIENIDQANLSVEIQPAGLNIPVSWSVIRAFDDNSKIKKLPGNSEDPGLRPDAGNNLKATLTANAAGGFRVRAYIDCNANAKFDERTDKGVRVDREPFILLNLILFRVQCVNNTSGANPRAADLSGGGVLRPSGLIVDGTGMPIMVSTGDFAGTGNDAVDMKAVIRVIGSGADGKRGLDYLFAGWVNNELNCPGAPNPNNWGEDATHHHQTPAPPVAPLMGLRCYWDLDGARISGPMLDAGGRYGDRRGIGGTSCIGTMGGAEPPVNKMDDRSGIGQSWTVANSDSPTGPIQDTHPNDATAQLVRFTFNLNFQCALLVWTNINKTPEPAATATDTDNACCRSYSTVQTNSWQVRFESTFDAAFTETNVTKKSVTFTKDPNPKRRATPAKGSGFETRAPGGLTQGKFDQPFDPAHPENP